MRTEHKQGVLSVLLLFTMAVLKRAKTLQASVLSFLKLWLSKLLAGDSVSEQSLEDLHEFLSPWLGLRHVRRSKPEFRRLKCSENGPQKPCFRDFINGNTLIRDRRLRFRRILRNSVTENNQGTCLNSSTRWTHVCL